MSNTFPRDTCQRAAEAMIRNEGGRVTDNRVRVLALLLGEEQAITHREIEERLPDHHTDRVTLYRVLQWLVDKALIHKISSDDRVWRFHANHDAYMHQHAHFKCTKCAKVVCLEDMPSSVRHLALPSGYRFQEIELTIKGLCKHCG